jgi:hypothetical protein
MLTCYYTTVSAGALLVLMLLISSSLLSTPEPRFNKHEKAFYADQATVNFVRLGWPSPSTPPQSPRMGPSAACSRSPILKVYPCTWRE